MSENAELWTGMLIGFIVLVWPAFFTGRRSLLTEKDLVGISTEYEGIDQAYKRHTVAFWISLSFSLILMALWVDKRGLGNSNGVALIGVTLFFSALAFSEGLFAMRKGVYSTKWTFDPPRTYAYDEGDRMRRLGRWQIYSALIVLAGSVGIGVTL